MDKKYEIYSGIIFDNLIQASSETEVPEQLIEYSYYHDEIVKYMGRKYKFIDLKDKIYYAE